MKLKGRRIAILAADGFEQSELFTPLDTLKNEGAQVEIVSLKDGEIKGWSDGSWGKSIDVDKTVDAIKADDYDGLVLPGGVINPDLLRKNDRAVEFVREFFTGEKQKPVAAICHGPWTLINAKVIEGRKVTSYDSIRMDLENAGASWVNEEVVVDNGLVTSRTPEDLNSFTSKMVEEFREGAHRKES